MVLPLRVRVRGGCALEEQDPHSRHWRATCSDILVTLERLRTHVLLFMARPSIHMLGRAKFEVILTDKH